MDRFQLTQRISILGITANLLLLAGKLAIGTISRSQAMIADGFNSAGDVFASAMSFAGNKIASRPEDHNHPYGHGKAEYVFSMIISFSLFLVAYRVLRSSLNAIIKSETFTFSWWLVGMAGITILLKFGLFLYTRKAGQKENNLLILAISEDHRNDVFVTSSTLLGILLGSRGITWVDGVVGIGIACWIAYTAVRIFLRAYGVLMDTNMDKTLKASIVKAICSIEGVDHVDDVAAKPIGVRYIIIVKVSVDGHLTVNESHVIAGRIREKVRAMKQVGDAVVHINPV